MSARLLLIAPDNLAAQIRPLAEAEGWTVHTRELGSNCLSAAQELRPDLIVLNVETSSNSFPDLCRCIRSIDEVSATLLVTLVHADQKDSGRLFEAGVDECWPQAESAELRVRLRTAYARYQSLKHPSLLRRGDVELDLDRFTVKSGGPPSRLTKSQLTVLKYLMQHSGVFVSHKELLERAWCRSDVDFVAVRVCMTRLRRALAATGAANVIRSVKGGYLFDTETNSSRPN